MASKTPAPPLELPYDLYLCEKPTQAEDLAKALKATARGNGCLHNGTNIIVTWAYGHLLALYEPHDYDESLKSWSLDYLPIIPDPWKYQVKRSGAKQYNIIRSLMGGARTLYIATDFDREGESIARSLIERFRYDGPVKRVCLRALNQASIKAALQDIRDGSESIHMHFAARVRQRADWLIGMNLSRLYTVLVRQTGYKDTLHVGRVLSVIIYLLCHRDRAIAVFTPTPYWVLSVTATVQNGSFTAYWTPPDNVADSSGRCINKTFAEQVAHQVSGAPAVVRHAETKPGKESAPLPFDLSALQQYANRHWGYTTKQVSDGAQSLYETHKATTYPRTDCRYLPTSKHAEAPDILQALINSDPEVSGIVAGADPARQGRAFNDKKVDSGSHDAITPTSEVVDITNMSPVEWNLYDAIRRHFVAQFYSDAEFKRTEIIVEAGEHQFSAKGKTPLKQGWKVLFTEEQADADSTALEQDYELPEQDKLPKVNQGEPASLAAPELDSKSTRPPPHFTEATLIAALKNIAPYVPEERFKKILKDTSGIGTTATRGDIIEGAVTKGYIVRKKVLTATEKAYALLSVLPPAISSPGMTAAWEQELEKIAAGKGNMKVFQEQITKWISSVVTQIKSNAPALSAPEGPIAKAFANAKPPTFDCFNCGGELKRIKGKNGFFWGCQTEACRKTFPDSKGKPMDRKPEAEDAPDCTECGKTMRLRKGKAPGKKRATKFWGCTGYPECKATLPYKRKAPE